VSMLESGSRSMFAARQPEAQVLGTAGRAPAARTAEERQEASVAWWPARVSPMWEVHWFHRAVAPSGEPSGEPVQQARARWLQTAKAWAGWIQQGLARWFRMAWAGAGWIQQGLARSCRTARAPWDPFQRANGRRKPAAQVQAGS
jgi:hypothetical protein